MVTKSTNQKIQSIEKIENVIYNSLESQQYHENTCFIIERLAPNMTRLITNVTRYGIVPVTAINNMKNHLDQVFGLENIRIEELQRMDKNYNMMNFYIFTI